jgi:hypothetical protein
LLFEGGKDDGTEVNVGNTSIVRVLPGWQPDRAETKPLPINAIRRDGGAQRRAVANHSTVRLYGELINDGVVFPPVRTWFDGGSYWLSDGFQRLAEAELIGAKEILSDIFVGSLEDARWDSYGANSHVIGPRAQRPVWLVLTSLTSAPGTAAF